MTFEQSNDIIQLSQRSGDSGYINPTSNILSIPVPLTRAGIFLYEDERYPNGIRRDYRPPEEVMDAASLETITNANLPMIRLHPDVGIVTAESFKGVDFVGSVGREIDYAVRELEDGSLETDGIVNGTITIYDQEMIDQYKRGEMKSGSLGYTTKRIYEPGSVNGHAFDAIQTNIRYNHISGVPLGRFGIQDFDQRVNALLNTQIEHDGFGFDDLGSLVNMGEVNRESGKRIYTFTQKMTTSKPKAPAKEEVSVDHLQGVIQGLREQVTTLQATITKLEGEVEEHKNAEPDSEETQTILNDALLILDVAQKVGVAEKDEDLRSTVVNDTAGLIGRIMGKVSPKHSSLGVEQSLGYLSVMNDSGALAAWIDAQGTDVKSNGTSTKPKSDTAVETAQDQKGKEDEAPKAKTNRFKSRRKAWLNGSVK